MSKVISFRDLLLIEELSVYNEIELLHVMMDEKVNHYLAILGFDLDYGVLYVPNKHRDMQGKVAVGYRAVGEISINRNFINSPFCSMEERLIAAAYQDPSLAAEMSRMMGGSINFAKMSGVEDMSIEDLDEYPPEDIEPDYEEVSAQIKFLENLRDTIRGSYLNDYGNIKTPQEYQNATVSA